MRHAAQVGFQVESILQLSDWLTARLNLHQFANLIKEVVEGYYDISRKISTAIKLEEERCGYLKEEVEIWKAHIDKIADRGNISQEKISNLYNKTLNKR